MFIFALISEIPYDLMMAGDAPFLGMFREVAGIFNGSGFDFGYFLRSLGGLIFHQNVMFTFFIALLMLRLLDWAKSKNTGLFVVMIPVSCVLGYLLGTLCSVDYYGFGVLMVILFYLTREIRFGWIFQLVGMWIINVHLIGGMTIPLTIFGVQVNLVQQGLALLALIPIWLYNGKQGPHNKAIQYACYAFYPVHILVLALLALYVL